MVDIVQEWQDKNLNNYLKKNDSVFIENENYLLDSNTIHHIIDWLNSDDAQRHRKRLLRMSVPDALKMSLLWTKKLNKKFKLNISNENDEVESVLSMDNGFSMVKLNSKYSYEKEGSLMGHCVATYYDRDDTDIYSLRDKMNKPHCTIEFYEGCIRQIKGKGNQEVSPKYHSYIREFLNNFDFDEISSNDLKNINLSCFGTYLFSMDEKIPKEVKINKKIVVNKQKIEKPFNYLEINGDFILRSVGGQQILADEIIVNGDLLLEDVRGMLRLCNKLKVMGDVEIVDSSQLKILAKEVEVLGNVYVEDCKQFIQKINCSGVFEYENCPMIK